MSLLSQFWSDFLARFDGPLHFRLFVQPLMATIFAIRDGRRDAFDRRSPYIWSAVTDPSQHSYLLASGWKGIWKVFGLAFLLDIVYQFMEWHGLKPLQGLLTAITLAVLPYVLLRGLFTRLTRTIGRAPGPLK